MFFFIFASICQFLRGFPTRLGLSCFLQPAVAFAALLLICFVLEIRPWDISTNGLGQDDPARYLTATRFREYHISSDPGTVCASTMSLVQLQICRICSSLGKSGRSWAKLGHHGLSWSLCGATFPEQARTLASWGYLEARG